MFGDKLILSDSCSSSSDLEIVPKHERKKPNKKSSKTFLNSKPNRKRSFNSINPTKPLIPNKKQKKDPWASFFDTGHIDHDKFLSDNKNTVK